MFLVNYFKSYLENNTENKFYYLSLIKEKNNNFSIHGLWPQYSINRYPTFCKNVNFDVNKIQPILPQLNKVWYSNRNNNDEFWKHEYEKHGSCVFTPLTELEYFEKTLDLYDEAIKLELPEKFYNQETNKCLIPVNIDFKFKNL